MWGEFETVYAVTDYVDAILAGVADFEGSPHVFVLERLDGTLYRLTPVTGGAVPSLTSSPARDMWKPTPAIEGLVRAAVTLQGGGFLVQGEFSPARRSASKKPALRVRWKRDGV